MNNTIGHAHGETVWLQLARHLQKQQFQQLNQLGELTSQLSVLVHMLQCRCGASNIFLCSGGRLCAAECRADGALVDERLALFYISLERARTVAGSALRWHIARAVGDLLQFPALREQIVRWQTTTEATTGQFSHVIRHLLSTVSQLNDSINGPPVAGRMVALYSFMQDKEPADQECALDALGFTRGEFGDSLCQQLMNRIGGQQSCFDSFRALGSPATIQLLITQYQAGLNIEQLRRIACTRQPVVDGGEAALRWFGLQTRRFEHLHEVKEQPIDDLLSATDALLVDSTPGWLASEEVDTLTPCLGKQLLPLVRQQTYELQQLSSQSVSLEDTLEERKLIERAKNLLIIRQGVQEEQAWQTLCKMAMNKNQHMVEIARTPLMVKVIWPLTPKEQIYNRRVFSVCRRCTFT